MHLIIEQDKADTLLPRIFRAAVEMFVQHGIDGTTIKDIAREAGVSEGALYRHFKSKDDLAYHLFATHVNAFSLELAMAVARQNNFKDKVKAYISLCFEAFEKERSLFTYLILSEHRELKQFPATFRHPGHVAMDLIEQGVKQGKAGLDPLIGSSIFVGSLIRLCLMRIRGSMKEDLRNQVESVSKALLRSLNSE